MGVAIGWDFRYGLLGWSNIYLGLRPSALIASHLFRVFLGFFLFFPALWTELVVEIDKEILL